MKLRRHAFSLLILCSTFCSCGASVGTSGTGGSAQGIQEQRGSEKPGSRAEGAPVDPNKFAVVIAGVAGEQVYGERFGAQAFQLYDALTTQLGFAEKNVFLLSEKPVVGPENGGRQNVSESTAAEVRKALDRIRLEAKPDSLVLVFLIGHGSFDSNQAKFNLVGPDLTAKDYAALLDGLPSRRIVFVNSASCSGEFVKTLGREGRIVITATRSGNEQNVTVFAKYFIEALAGESADADKNGRISMLEAFNYATRMISDWYKEQNRLATEHALLDDSGDGVGHEEAGGGDGLLARTTYLDSKPLIEAKGDEELARLIEERGRLEESIEKLKARKSEMKPEEYEKELEGLLLRLAEVNQAIRSRND